MPKLKEHIKLKRIDELAERVKQISNGSVTLIKDSFVRTDKKMIFIDIEYPNIPFSALITNVLRGSRHPLSRRKRQGLKRRTTDEKIKAVLAMKNPHCRYVEGSYDIKTKHITVIDPVYGEYTTYVQNVISGRSKALHKKRAADSQRLTKQQIEEKILNAHGDTVTIDFSTYKTNHFKAKFIDKEYGEWMCQPSNVFNGVKHPKRSGVERIKHNLRTSYDVEAEIQKTRPYISLDHSTYTVTHTKAKFIHATEGEWWVKPNQLLNGGDHPSVRIGSKFKKLFAQKLSRFPHDFILDAKKKMDRYEIDFYFEEKKLGIEYHGLYWHSEKFRGKTYHAMKHKLANKNNIKLLQFFADEVHFRADIVLDMIRRDLCVPGTQIASSRLVFRQVLVDQAILFLTGNQLNPDYDFTEAFGLFNGDELVQLACLNGSRINLVHKMGIDVDSGFGSLISHIKLLKQGPLELILDKRFYVKEDFEKYGFVLKKHLRPGEHWADNKMNRILVKTKKSDSKLRLKESKRFRIYDAGYYVMELI